MAALYELLKIAKVLSVAMLFAGTLGAFVAHDLEDRRRFAYAIAGPGFALTWVCGFCLAYVQQVSLLAWWIGVAIVLSLFSLQVVLFSVGIEGRRRPGVAAMAIVPLIGCVAAMVLRAHG